MISIPPKFRSKATTLHLRASSGAVKMPLAQAHPFEPMPVTHEDNLEVSTVSMLMQLLGVFINRAIGFLPFDTAFLKEVWICGLSNTSRSFK
jgi:hypothetical protein